jgi:glucose-1-phosphate thymidylyltransferase
VLPVDGWHRYRGDGSELLALNRITLDRVAGSIPVSARRGNRIEGRVLIDRTATVRSSVITGPAVVGPDATVIDAYLGPYSSIGAGARIEGAEIERSIVAPGASVMHIGGRLVSSLVGREARIYRDFSLPRALRLWVGEGDQVALC